ncbi:CLUMA_CG004754, isoform A [Clunio marinus]|uniref:CLUMA_CG004754, isoform A n=1 Tax=Clunio marinus TaxID=568069 RepID=A0A1J1HU31_9DIPT|nr:CLUMA_CG004754, isoform A [Clunio marinus]
MDVIADLPDQERRLVAEMDQQVPQATAPLPTTAETGEIHQQITPNQLPIQHSNADLTNQTLTIPQIPPAVELPPAANIHQPLVINNQPIVVRHHYHYSQPQHQWQQQILKSIQQTLLQAYPFQEFRCYQ